MVRDTQYSDSESDAGSVDEETARGSVPGFLAEGNIHANRGDWSRAADSFTKAITMDATNRTALIGRTKCYIAAGKPELAIKDVDVILEKDKTYYKGIYLKGEALFSSGAFEFALIHFHRGHRLRPDLEQFRLGIQKCQEAIDLALSDHRAMRRAAKAKAAANGYDVTDSMAVTASGAAAGAGGGGRVSARPGTQGGRASARPGTQSGRASARPGTQSGSRPTTGARDGKLPPIGHMPDDVGSVSGSARGESRGKPRPAGQVLGELNADLQFLESLQNDQTFNERDSAGILGVVDDGLKYLGTRTEFWRQQGPQGGEKPKSARRPGTSTTRGSASRASRTGGPVPPSRGSERPGSRAPSRGQSRGASRPGTRGGTASGVSGDGPGGAGGSGTSKVAIGRQRYLDNSRMAMQRLEAINAAMERDDFHYALKIAKSFLSRLNSIEVADKARIMATVYDQLGTIYLELDKLNLATIHFRKDLDLAVKNNFKDSFLRALGNLGHVYQRMGDVDSAVAMWEKKLGALDAVEEEPELCENIARCYFSNAKYDLAIEYGERGARAAVQAFDKDREMSCTFIVGHSYFNLADYDRAIEFYEQYLGLAREANDTLARANALSSLGNAYLQLGEVSKSIELQQEALTLSTDLNKGYAKGGSQQAATGRRA